MNDQRFCVDCAHCKSFGPFLGRQCMRPTSDKPDLVSGTLPRLFESCNSQRERGWAKNRCGPQGKYWEEKA